MTDLSPHIRAAYLAAGPLGDNLSLLHSLATARTTPARRIKAIARLLSHCEGEVEALLAALDALDEAARKRPSAKVLMLVKS